MREFEETVQQLGFSWAPFSLYHRTPLGASPEGSWTYRASSLADRQLHVILFAQHSGEIDVYAHLEPNWLRHPLAHVQQDHIDRKEGVRLMRSWLNDGNVDSTRRSKLSRRLTYLRQRLLG